MISMNGALGDPREGPCWAVIGYILVGSDLMLRSYRFAVGRKNIHGKQTMPIFFVVIMVEVL
jgi:hypothetical protein